MRTAITGVTLLLAALTLFGCGGKPLSPSEEAAIRDAIRKHYDARKDKKREVRIKQITEVPGGAKARVAVKYPDFHTVATEHVLIIKKTGDGWKVDDKAEH